MNVTVIWKSGSITEFSTTFFSSGEGAGIALSDDYLDLGDPYGRGIAIMRRAWTFRGTGARQLSPTDEEEIKLIVPAEDVCDVLALEEGGRVVLERVRDVADESGVVRPERAFDGELRNMLLPAGPAADLRGAPAHAAGHAPGSGPSLQDMGLAPAPGTQGADPGGRAGGFEATFDVGEGEGDEGGEAAGASFDASAFGSMGW